MLFQQQPLDDLIWGAAARVSASDASEGVFCIIVGRTGRSMSGFCLS